MKFLIDNCLSPYLAEALSNLEHDAVHVREYNLHQAEDLVILQRAILEERIIISADTDFSTILALNILEKPSLILFKKNSPRHPKEQIKLLSNYLEKFSNELKEGSIVIFEEERIRIRKLPILH
ncbi:MAG: DUF5615 family PIN-like protein [Deltaproteobacteria bacterium]|nr:DUF5615 family PIN-like protein [Deltaproteobacteria bacterium]